MTRPGEKSLAQLRSRGAGPGLEFLLSVEHSDRLRTDHPLTTLFAHESSSREPSLHHWEELEFIDKALQNVATHRADLEPWLDGQLRLVWSDDTQAALGALAELEALGTIQQAFPTCKPVERSKHEQTPDFSVDGAFCVEVYCPRTTDHESVAEQLQRQTGCVKIALSHPHTGSRGNSLVYPANKIADRFLNNKRDGKQYRDGVPNVLYVDARREWKLATQDIMPFQTKYSGGVQWIGTFGVWHAFYGSKGRSTMLRDGVSLQYFGGSDVHEQVRDGLFRESTAWSAGVVALTDGIIVLENPWAQHPLAIQTLHSMLRLHRMRVEFSWYRMPDMQSLEFAVANMLGRLESTFRELRLEDDATGGDA